MHPSCRKISHTPSPLFCSRSGPPRFSTTSGAARCGCGTSSASCRRSLRGRASCSIGEAECCVLAVVSRGQAVQALSLQQSEPHNTVQCSAGRLSNLGYLHPQSHALPVQTRRLFNLGGPDRLS